MVNRLKKLSPEFRKILKRSSVVSDSLGFKIYLVGGVVRDLILRKDVFDLDIVVEGDAISFADKLAKDIKAEFIRHHAFGTATVYFGKHKIDFATARQEKYSHWGVLPKVKPAELSKDLFRRDFTINAMAISLNREDYGKLIDLYNGLTDLRKGLIRILHDLSFLDDPTRILRAIRFEQRFGFRIEPKTFKLLKDALSKKALCLPGPHRLRDELTLMLKEPKPYRYIRRVNELSGFNFIDSSIKLNKEKSKLLLRIEKAISEYNRGPKLSRSIDSWIVYLSGLLHSLSQAKLSKVLSDFGFRKGERIIVKSTKQGLRKIAKLNQVKKPHRIYKALNDYSFESILFFYSYYSDKSLRKSIKYFLKHLVNIRLKVKGRDLKKRGVIPSRLYSKILKRLLDEKIDNSLSTKKEELLVLDRIVGKIKPKDRN